MAKLTILGILAIGVCLTAATEKQINLEDIEKDNLRAAEQTKREKELEQLKYQQYQQVPTQYNQHTYSQEAAAYPTAYQQYLFPQQYVQAQSQQQYIQPQQLYSAYSPLTSNALTSSYTSASSLHPYQSYYTPQLAAAVQGLQSGQQTAAETQTQQYIMALAAPAVAGLQQQAYYQVLPKQYSQYVQYVPSPTTQATQYYYQPQAPQQAQATTAPALIYATPQQYVPAFQPLPASKAPAAYQQFTSTAPQTFTSGYATREPAYETAAYPSQGSSSYTSNSVYHTGQPTFISVKAPQHLVASPGQQQQFLQSQAEIPTTTISPFKYLNSPQYLAQNYNTIQSSHLLPKHPYSSGIKSNINSSIKVTGNSGYITPSVSSGSASTSSTYSTYRGIAG